MNSGQRSLIQTKNTDLPTSAASQMDTPAPLSKLAMTTEGKSPAVVNGARVSAKLTNKYAQPLLLALPFAMCGVIGFHAVTQYILLSHINPHGLTTGELQNLDDGYGLVTIKFLLAVLFYGFGAYSVGTLNDKFIRWLVLWPLVTVAFCLFFGTLLQWVFDIFYSAQLLQLGGSLATSVASMFVLMSLSNDNERRYSGDAPTYGAEGRATTLAHSRFMETAPPKVSDPEI